MATIRCNGNQSLEDEDEETLSLCDLPTNDHEIDTNSNKEDNDPVDFEFGCCHAAVASQSPENMCSADEIFFQGQLLPLRHSVSSDSVGVCRKIKRSVSMSVVSSRSNENDPRVIRSNGYGYRIRNRFHSHPSPSPQIRTQSFPTLSHPHPKTSSLWSFLQVGLMKPHEIGLSDLKNRSKRFGSHNSSTSSSMNSTIDQNQNDNQNQIGNSRKNTKKKQRLFFGGCKCSADSIESIIKETVPMKKTTKKENIEMIGERKQAVTRHRTFEWLKQLSIAAPGEA